MERDIPQRGPVSRLGSWLGLGQANPLARRFLLASLAVLLAGGVVIGWWVGDQLERGIIDRTASITGLYVQSFLAPELEALGENEWLSDTEKANLDALLTDTTFGERVVALKVWRPDGVIVYSPDRTLIGERFELSEGLQMALTGTVVAEMSELDADENVSEQARGFDRLLEMYLPVRERGGEQIIGVAEFYQLPADIEQQVADARLQSWVVVGGAVTLAFLLLYGIVRQGGETIDRQRLALEGQVTELSTLLAQNEQLRQRVRVAAERTTTLSERALRRISSDLHDGPAQLMALAMLRLDQLRSSDAVTDAKAEAEIAQLQQTLDEALADMRGIAAGLRLPELTTLSAADICRRAVDDHTRRTGIEVQLDVNGDAVDASLSTKIALFRALQELLSNSTRHGEGRDVSVSLVADSDRVALTVSDAGPGFGGARVGEEGRLGLAGLREQAELLGGSFEIGERPGGGARVAVTWPR
jgi:signal transduction histidine kinase